MSKIKSGIKILYFLASNASIPEFGPFKFGMEETDWFYILEPLNT